MPEDLESYWEDIRYRSPIRVVTDKASDLDSMLLLAAEKAAADLSRKFGQRPPEQRQLSTELLGEMVAEGVRMFMTHWSQGLREQNLAGLIELVLEGQNLEPEEMLAFVQALPESLLQKITASAFGTANGIHGVLAVEYHRRQGAVQSIELARDPMNGDRVRCRFRDQNGRNIQFFLDEPFDLNDE